jgi:hypothetical protein
MEKLCKKCNYPKDTSEFGVCRSNLDKLQAYCISCNRKQAKAYYQSNEQKKIHGFRAKIRRQKISEALLKIKEKAGCCFCKECCGVCLDFHHIGSDKDFNLGSCAFSIKKIAEEINKCEVICSNCHRKVHAKMLSVDIARKFDLADLFGLITQR